jgi:hypothetical protein
MTALGRGAAQRWQALAAAPCSARAAAQSASNNSCSIRPNADATVALDRDVAGLEDIGEHDRLEIVEVDLENGEPFPLHDRRFAGVVVTNYLHRPILDQLVSAVATSGALVYETFAVGNGRFGRPTRPEFLLRPGELLDVVRGELRVVAFEDLVVDHPRPAAVQRIAAVRDPQTAL